MICDLEIAKMLIVQEFGGSFSSLINNKKFKPIVSYTTRPIRSSETEGVEHFFINDEKADKLLEDKNNILAYTEINGNRYFALKDQLKEYNVYVIDPIGLKNLKENHPDINIKSIYITADKYIRETRYLSRENLKYDDENIQKFLSRDSDEDTQFSEFENSDNDHITIVNNTPYIMTCLLQAFKYFYNNYSDDTLFCILGRTASGKDTIVKHLVNLI